jgi:quercetin dioxygenase-like cupin family protein
MKPYLATITALLAAASAQAQTAEKPLAISPTDPALAWGGCPPGMPSGCRIAVLHGNPAQPNADVWLQLPAGAVLPKHKHSSAERMTLVSGELRVRYDGHPAAVLKPGSYAYGPAGMPHDGACVSKDPCTLFIAFEGPVDAVMIE